MAIKFDEYDLLHSPIIWTLDDAASTASPDKHSRESSPVSKEKIITEIEIQIASLWQKIEQLVAIKEHYEHYDPPGENDDE